MDNENKELQNGVSEAELEEKVRQDVSEKIRDAAAELEEEIAAAEEVAEEAAEESLEEETEEVQEPVIVDYDEEGNPIYAEEDPGVIVGYDEEGNPIYAEEEKPEPKTVLVKLRNWILSLVGAAVLGAVLLLVGMQVPEWAATAGSSTVPATPLFQSGKTVAKVSGETITDQDLEFYIYQEASKFVQENGGVVSNPAEYDWNTEVEEGKTAEEVVKERALRTAVENILLMDAGKKAKVEWDEDMESAAFDIQMFQLEKQYNKELVDANAVAMGYLDMNQYKRMTLRNSFAVAVAEDMQKNPDTYYPDEETLTEFAATDGATVKHILVAEAEAPAEGEEAAPAEGEENPEEAIDKKALAEEILKKAQEGADFDALVEEFNEDPGMTEAGYVVTESSNFVPEFKEAALALGMNEISGIVKTEHGYHIIKRIPGEMDLFNYWRTQEKIKTKQKRLDAISVAEVVARVTAGQENFTALFQKYQEENPTANAGY